MKQAVWSGPIVGEREKLGVNKEIREGTAHQMTLLFPSRDRFLLFLTMTGEPTHPHPWPNSARLASPRSDTSEGPYDQKSRRRSFNRQMQPSDRSLDMPKIPNTIITCQ